MSLGRVSSSAGKSNTRSVEKVLHKKNTKISANSSVYTVFSEFLLGRMLYHRAVSVHLLAKVLPGEAIAIVIKITLNSKEDQIHGQGS